MKSERKPAVPKTTPCLRDVQGRGIKMFQCEFFFVCFKQNRKVCNKVQALISVGVGICERLMIMENFSMRKYSLLNYA